MQDRDTRDRLMAYLVNDKCARVFLVVPAYGVCPVGWIKSEGKISDSTVEDFYYANRWDIEQQRYFLKENAN